ncbi:3-deoxy-7-phosphoheptulonate synthase [Anaerosphaera multitolerans]|uniref:3-deoxy-7-phosphoheptulonate synthase n=1 Tax=Anaerosphaera multitolerans TaxID=2487351 RepID=A0A437S656_9FIRM|nr:3-deoxy-7-phosphoheptulonate synthase [Anaerosphaera multitolerans]RVU54500.1 3-deoxy-7-phosphoheptulonate synthase [Anaerosphaera multitolerans]
MITVLKEETTEKQRNELISWLEGLGLRVHVSVGDYKTVLGLIGDTSKIDVEMLEVLDIVEKVTRITEPFKSANRKFNPKNSVIDVKGTKCGDGNFIVIAGPCSVESEEQIVEIAKKVKASGASMLRGGAFKPRTSPYDFQGLKAEGLELLLKAREITNLPIVTEIVSINHIPLFEDVDVIQVGARNMQNFELLKELGKTNKTILLKRGFANTIKEFLMSAEYIMSSGNENIILCERGIRTFETYTRNTLDLSAVPLLHNLTHLPVIVDPSHGTGRANLVKPMAAAATACGADGLTIEVHNNPKEALSDGEQSLTPEEFEDVIKQVNKIREAIV